MVDYSRKSFVMRLLARLSVSCARPTPRTQAVRRRAAPLGASPSRGRKEKDRFDAFDVVGVPFSYADRLAEKRRPALVFSNRRLAPFGLIWLVMITSADNASWSCDVPITDLARAWLPAPSVVRTAKIACIESARIERRGGRLDRAAAKAVARKLEGFLGSA